MGEVELLWWQYATKEELKEIEKMKQKEIDDMSW